MTDVVAVKHTLCKHRDLLEHFPLSRARVKYLQKRVSRRSSQVADGGLCPYLVKSEVRNLLPLLASSRFRLVGHGDLALSRFLRSALISIGNIGESIRGVGLVC